MRKVMICLVMLLTAVALRAEQQQYPTPEQYQQYYDFYVDYYRKQGYLAPTPEQYSVQYHTYQEQLKAWELQQQAAKAAGNGPAGEAAVASNGQENRETASVDNSALTAKSSEHSDSHSREKLFVVPSYTTGSSLVFGAAYEYQFEEMSWLGFTALANYVTSSPSIIQGAGGVMIYPMDGVKLRVGPTVLLQNSATQFGVLGGVSYDYEQWGLTFSPTVNLTSAGGSSTTFFGLGVGFNI